MRRLVNHRTRWTRTTRPQPSAPKSVFSGKASDLGFGHLGNGITVWDSTRERSGDYIQVAHISGERVIEWRQVRISDEQRKAIEDFAATADPQVSQTQDQKVFSTRPQKNKER